MTLLGPGGIVITPTDPPSDTVFYSLTNVGGDFPYQEVYSLRDAPAGQWTVVLDNLPEPGTYGVTMVGAKPGPRLTGVTAANLTPERVAIGWSLAAAAPVTLTLHANPGPTTTTVVITDTCRRRRRRWRTSPATCCAPIRRPSPTGQRKASKRTSAGCRAAPITSGRWPRTG